MVEITGGKDLAETLGAIAKAIGVKSATLRVGFLAGATYPNGTPVAMVAAMNEFGHRTLSTKYLMFTPYGEEVPPRPFFRNMVENNKNSWPVELAGALKATNYDATASLKMLGEVMAGQLRQSIRDTNSPPLKESTIKRKGFDTVLIDSGHMLQSVDFEIKA